MIAKIICWLFGHVIREAITTDYRLVGTEYVPIWHWEYKHICPRCGKKIREKND